MANDQKDQFLYSLRGRIKAASAVLMSVALIVGVAAYFIISQFAVNPNVAIIGITVIVIASCAALGRWLAADVLAPIETVALLARSLERSPSASLPATTGAAETDELLRSLHRNSQQLQNLIGLMDDVAGGKTDAAIAPLQNPDRLSISFQRLVAKVIESISAKQQLDALATSLNRLKGDIAGIKSGSVDIVFRGDLYQTAEIADAFRWLIDRYTRLSAEVAGTSAAAQTAGENARKIICEVIEREEASIDRMQRAAEMLSATPQRVQAFAERVDSVLREAFGGEMSEKLLMTEPRFITADIPGRVIDESRKHVEKLRQGAAAALEAARAAHEIERRSNLVALNTNVQSGAEKVNVRVVVQELEEIAKRAGALRKEIVALSDAAAADTARLDASLDKIFAEVNDLASAAAHENCSAVEIAARLNALSVLREEIVEFTAQRLAERESLVKLLPAPESAAENAARLKAAEKLSETGLASVSALADTLARAKHTPLAAPPNRAAVSGEMRRAEIAELASEN